MARRCDLMPNDDSICSIREVQALSYSSNTFRRALLVWLHLGRQPDLVDFCNFYHHLEKIERSMTSEGRARSRARELRLYYRQPPVPNFNHWVQEMTKVDTPQIKRIIPDIPTYRLEGFCDIVSDKHINKQAIDNINRDMRHYCKSHSITLGDLFKDFEGFTKKTNTQKSFDVITGYLKNMFLKDDLRLYDSLNNIIEYQLSFIDDVLGEE